MLVRGLVLGLNHAGGYANVQLADGTVTRAAWLSDWAPCPRSIVWLDQPVSGVFLVVGMEAARRVIVHEDFLVVPGGVDGDTFWWGVGGGGTVSESPNTVAQGAIDIVTAASAGAFWGISKGNNMLRFPQPPGAIWMSARWAPDLTFTGGSSTVAHHVGFANNASNNGFGSAAGASVSTIYAANNAGVLNWQLRNILDTAGANDVDSGLPVTLGMHYTDLIVVAGLVSAMWIDGVGPFVNGQFVPPAEDSRGPQATAVIYPTINQAVGFTVDYIHVEKVNAVRTQGMT